MSEFRLVGVGSGNARAGNVDGREREPEAAIGRESCKPSRLETFIFRRNNGENKNAIDASRERRYPTIMARDAYKDPATRNLWGVRGPRILCQMNDVDSGTSGIGIAQK